MNTSLAIQYLYPTAISGIDYILVDSGNGKGTRITNWNITKLGPIPTMDSLVSADSLAIQAAQIAEYKFKIQAVLTASDTTVLRCAENGIPLPKAWVDYRKALRKIIGSKSVTTVDIIPVPPPYPSGT